MKTFTYNSARSWAITVTVAVVVSIETAVLHVAFVGKHPVIAWLLTGLSVLTLGWLVADARAFARGALRLDADALHVAVGRRWVGRVPRDAVVKAFRATWRDLPADARETGYVNLMKPAEPNVIMILSSPVPMRLFGRVPRNVTKMGLHLDTPDDFVIVLAAPIPSLSAPGSGSPA